MSDRAWFGMLGGLVLAVGIFTPAISVPVAGGVSLFKVSEPCASLLLVLATLSCALSGHGRCGWLIVTGGLGLASVLTAFVTVHSRVLAMREELGAGLEDGPWRGIAELGVEAVQMQWGWSLLLIGSMLLLVSACKGERRPPPGQGGGRGKPRRTEAYRPRTAEAVRAF